MENLTGKPVIRIINDLQKRIIMKRIILTIKENTTDKLSKLIASTSFLGRTIAVSKRKDPLIETIPRILEYTAKAPKISGSIVLRKKGCKMKGINWATTVPDVSKITLPANSDLGITFNTF